MNLIKRVTGVVLVVKLNEILFLLDIGIVIFSKFICLMIEILMPNFKKVFLSFHFRTKTSPSCYPSFMWKLMFSCT